MHCVAGFNKVLVQNQIHMALEKVDLDKILERTRYLVSGFIRESEKLLENDAVVSNDIASICMSYTWNKFEEAGKLLEIRLSPSNRPSVADLVAENIMIEDSEVIAELISIAQQFTRMEDAIQELASRLPFDAEVNRQVAATMMRHINDTEDDVSLS